MFLHVESSEWKYMGDELFLGVLGLGDCHCAKCTFSKVCHPYPLSDKDLLTLCLSRRVLGGIHQ